MTYTITPNTTFNSLEIAFDCKPSADVLSALKALKFRWNSKRGLWYGFAAESAVRAAIEGEEKPAAKKAETVNKYGVQVGDIFSASWGYEQTNNDFFQVVALVGAESVRVREVELPLVESSAVSPMSEDRVYKVVRDVLPPVKHSVFIKDQERGDVKRLKLGYNADPEEARKNCHFKLSSYCNAYKVNGDFEKTYESWYA